MSGAYGSDELVARYDAHGNTVGSVLRSRVRGEALWHGSSYVLVRSGDGERVYVHRRAGTKDIFPGMHDCWAGGVIAAGESPDECARRELAEELGVRAAPLRYLFTYRYESPSVRVHAFCYEVRWDGPVVHQETEIADGWWLAVDELRVRLLDENWPFVPDGRELLAEWLASRG